MAFFACGKARSQVEPCRESRKPDEAFVCYIRPWNFVASARWLQVWHELYLDSTEAQILSQDEMNGSNPGGHLACKFSDYNLTIVHRHGPHLVNIYLISEY